MNLNTLFSFRLKEERERLGMSQQEAADLSGIRREMWGKYERGTAEPGISVVEHFCTHGADALYIVTGKHALPATPVDTDLLRQVIEGIDYALDNNNLSLDTSNKSSLIAVLYEHFSESEKVEQAVVNRFLRVATR
ncbi:hypothetical protein BH11PSE12_BH11PSE12_18380 [soil metagenome]